MKVDLKEFTTVDSIGEIDDDLDGSDTELNISELDDESLGIKYVKKVETLYCETCESYISHDFTNDNEEELTLKHCKTKIHLKLTRKNTEKDLEEMDQEETQLDQSESKEEETPDVNDCSDDMTKNDDSVNDGDSAEKPEVENNDEEDEEDETVLNIDILR